MPHLTYTFLMALLVSGATALPGNGGGRERCYRAMYAFLGCTASVLAGGWLMHFVHG